MFARINHVAIGSDNYALNGKFYEALFGLRPASKPRPARAVVLKDGYVGLNNNPRHEGVRSGLDHFGIEVEDIERAVERARRFDPAFEVVKRPSRRPFAAYSACDPEANIFDLSQRDIGVQKDVYAESEWTQPRRISHVTIRARDPERCARFYHDVFELALERKDEVYAVSDGRMTIALLPWRMSDYLGHDPVKPGIEHLGFAVESIEAVKREMDELMSNPRLASWRMGLGDESEARLRTFAQCPFGTFHMTDVEGAFIDLAEAHE